MAIDPHAGGAPRVRFWDEVFRRPITVKRFPPGLAVEGAAAGLLETWERWLNAPWPALLRAGELDLEEGKLTREWVAGSSLLELLRQRKKLPASDALPLARAAAAIFDDVAKGDLLASFGIDKLLVAFSGLEDDAAHRLMREPLAKWPAWSLRFEPLCLARLLTAAEEVTRPPQTGSGADLAPTVAPWLRLVRELLGGARMRPGVPLAALNDRANTILATAARRGAFCSARALAHALAIASNVPETAAAPPAMAEYVTPNEIEPGNDGAILRLDPLQKGSRTFQIVTRDELRFGRSTAHADVVTRFSEKMRGAVEQTKAIGRLMVAALLTGAGVILEASYARKRQAEELARLKTEQRIQQENETKAAAEKAQREAARIAALRGSISVGVVPASAKVQIGDQPPQLAPVAIPGLKLGTYAVLITADGYQPKTLSVEVKDNDLVHDLGTVTLVRSLGGLKVTSEPPGLLCEVRGKNTASGDFDRTTPFEMSEQPAGEYAVTVLRAGWPPDTRPISIASGKTAEEQFRFIGSDVTISSTPSAEVRRGAEKLGETPFVLKDQPPGAVQYTLVKTGYVDAVVEGELQSGKAHAFDKALEKKKAVVRSKSASTRGGTRQPKPEPSESAWDKAKKGMDLFRGFRGY